MTKKDIAAKMQEKTGIPATTSAKVLEDILDIMKDNLSRGEDIKIARFGRFEVKTRRPRSGRNPQTGDALIIPGHRVLIFKPSKLLQERL